ncbi:MAG: response regulator [Acidimicrobiales bacterium]|nr:response regulator [Acidimicrobiales bacterium]
MTPVSDTPSAEEMQTLRDVLRHYPKGARLHFGSPCRCPQCGDFGFVQNVAASHATNSCRVCNLEWVITRRALRAQSSLPAAEQPFSMLVDDPPPPAFANRSGLGARHPVLDADELGDETSDGELPIGALFDDDPPNAAGPSAPTPPADPGPRPERQPDDTPHPVAFTALDGEAGPDAAHVMQVLVVDDNPFELMLVESLIGHRLGQEIVVTPAATRVEGERRLARQPFDLVILDLDLPDSTGIFTMLEWRHGADTDVPVIALVTELDNGLLVQARVLGAAHVITVAQLEALADRGEVANDRFARLLRTTAAHIKVGDVSGLLAG